VVPAVEDNVGECIGVGDKPFYCILSHRGIVCVFRIEHRQLLLST
jgi:hypothetical protein